MLAGKPADIKDVFFSRYLLPFSLYSARMGSQFTGTETHCYGQPVEIFCVPVTGTSSRLTVSHKKETDIRTLLVVIAVNVQIGLGGSGCRHHKH